MARARDVLVAISCTDTRPVDERSYENRSECGRNRDQTERAGSAGAAHAAPGKHRRRVKDGCGVDERRGREDDEQYRATLAAREPSRPRGETCGETPPPRSLAARPSTR